MKTKQPVIGRLGLESHATATEFRWTSRIPLTAKAIKKYDANTNGRLDRDEMLQYRHDLAELRAPKTHAVDSGNR